MFDMRNSTDRRQVLTVLGIILMLSSVPAFLVLSSELAADVFPGFLAGLALYAVGTCWRRVFQAMKGEREDV